jgi:hypothetical protein
MTTQYILNRKNRAKELGLCNQCYKHPRQEGKTRCQKCLSRSPTRDQIDQKKVRAKELGLCTTCYTRHPVSGKTRCLECIENAKRNMERYRKDSVFREMQKKRSSDWNKNNKTHRNEQTRIRRRKIKELVLNHYGNKCNCPGCDVKEPKFLTIDHIHGGGKKHRKKIGRYGGDFYEWLVINNFPDGFQVLCFNCNCAKGFFGKCPHEEKNK